MAADQIVCVCVSPTKAPGLYTLYLLLTKLSFQNRSFRARVPTQRNATKHFSVFSRSLFAARHFQLALDRPARRQQIRDLEAGAGWPADLSSLYLDPHTTQP
jgi:hypothetical protein